MHRRLALVPLWFSILTACIDPALVRSTSNGALEITVGSRAQTEAPTALLRYGPSLRVGNGFVRTYVLFDEKDATVPREVGVAMDEWVMEGLPAPNKHAMTGHSEHEHVDNHVYLLTLPEKSGLPFQFVELDWNPGGHEPPGIYDKPHFDFHFYTVPQEDRAAVVPTDPDFQKKADMLPPEAERPPQYIVGAPPGTPAPGVPLMGVHWVDVRSPELQQMLGKPEAFQPFTKTFIYGSWEGKFTFLEPMITREYIMSKRAAKDAADRNEVVPISTAKSYRPAGYYPSAYRIAWDEESKEYRIALTQLAWRN